MPRSSSYLSHAGRCKSSLGASAGLRHIASTKAFTLIELLVVIGTITILSSLLLGAVSTAKQRSKQAVCISNLRQIGIAIHAYADDFGNTIPFGPIAPPFTSPASFYPTTGSPTSLLSLQGGTPVGLGLLLQNHIGNQSKILFCPGGDQPIDATKELAKVGISQAQGCYYYRHAGITTLFQFEIESPKNIRLDNLGLNRNDHPIRTLVMDAQFLCPPGLESFNIRPHTHHKTDRLNVLQIDGHVSGLQNPSGEFNVDVREGDLRDGFDKILKVFEKTDSL